MITLSEKRSDLRGSTIIFFVSKCVKSSVRTSLLICSSFSGENGHPVIICSLTSTAQLFLSRGGGRSTCSRILGMYASFACRKGSPPRKQNHFFGIFDHHHPSQGPIKALLIQMSCGWDPPAFLHPSPIYVQ